MRPSQLIGQKNMGDAYDELHDKCEALVTERNALAQALENFISIDNAENKLLLDKPNALMVARQAISGLEA